MDLISYKPIPQYDPPRSPRETLPTMYDLPSEDPEEPGLPDEYHDLQPQLLSRTLRLTDYARDNYFTASDLNLYYDVKHPLWHKRPDWFLVVNVPRLYDGTDLRNSYVIWQEGRYPDVVVEFLSPGTEREDFGRFYSKASKVPALDVDPSDEDAVEVFDTEPQPNGSKQQREKPPGKLEAYETYLRIPHYIVYSRYTQQLRYFKLDGGRYQEQAIATQNPRLWLHDLGIGLGVWDGVFEGISSHWLRWCDRDGNWLLTDTEQAQREKEQVQQEKEQAQQEKEQIQAQLRQAARNLVATGMAIPQIAAILGLSEAQVQTFCQQNDQP